MQQEQTESSSKLRQGRLHWVPEAEFKSFAVREDQESFPREANITSSKNEVFGH